MKRKNALVIFLVILVAILVLDRFTKITAIEHLADSPPIAFLPLFLDFALVYNTGGAFGIFEGGGSFFVLVAIVAVLVILIYLVRAKQLHLPIVLALALIAGGALGNAYDRAVGGAVPDFIHTLFIEFPVFNIADMALTVGEIGLLVAVAFYWFGQGRREEPIEETDDEERESRIRDEE